MHVCTLGSRYLNSNNNNYHYYYNYYKTIVIQKKTVWEHINKTYFSNNNLLE